MEDDLLICRCEEVTRSEVEEAIRMGLRTVNEIKRFTRAGFGLCQGKTCGRLICDILIREADMAPSEVLPGTSRPPVRPIPTRVLANRVSKEDE